MEKEAEMEEDTSFVPETLDNTERSSRRRNYNKCIYEINPRSLRRRIQKEKNESDMRIHQNLIDTETSATYSRVTHSEMSDFHIDVEPSLTKQNETASSSDYMNNQNDEGIPDVDEKKDSPTNSDSLSTSNTLSFDCAAVSSQPNTIEDNSIGYDSQIEDSFRNLNLYEEYEDRHSEGDDDEYDAFFKEMLEAGGTSYDQEISHHDSSRTQNVETVESTSNFDEILKSISENVRDVLATWTVTCGIEPSLITKLLHLMRDNVPELTLPLDARTILKTPKTTQNISKIAGGEYLHFGLKKCVLKIIEKRIMNNKVDEHIQLMIFIDGAPLGKSSEKNLWVILCSEKDIDEVFIVGIYCGEKKPENANEFLTPLTEDAIELLKDVQEVDGVFYKIDIWSLILDAPAKAFAMSVKYYSGYDSCTKCEIEGTSFKCVCFPGGKGVLRTDEKFRNNYYIGDYQKSECILNKIPRLGLVTNVPLDPMHLVYLGCTRKIMMMWLISPTKYKLSAKITELISEALVTLKPFIPNDFARTPRSLKHIKLMKATEFRLFLLYTGIIALKGYVDDRVYANFLNLHAAITILSNPILCQRQDYLDYAEKLLEHFLQEFEDLYGPEFVTYNFHNLLHLVEDCRKYGILDNFAAWRFENFIHRIKMLIRKGNQPLQQVMRRSSEIESVQELLKKMKSNEERKNLRIPHDDGPVTSNLLGGEQYKIIEFENTRISCHDNKNGCLLMNNNVILQALNFVECVKTKEMYVIGRQMRKLGDFYNTPLKSSDLGIYVVSDTYGEIESWKVDEIKCILCKFPYQDNFVVIPLLHTLTS